MRAELSTVQPFSLFIALFRTWPLPDLPHLKLCLEDTCLSAVPGRVSQGTSSQRSYKVPGMTFHNVTKRTETREN